jgi:glycosyltransferase involved in cell wall biosynthesis
MTNPSVCCICLTADRQRLTDRAVKCFLRRTYTASHLLIYDTGEKPYKRHVFAVSDSHMVTTVYNPSSRGRKIGQLRNEAIDMVKADIIVTWDSDDWSGPERLLTQVSSLREHPATGYHNLLFADARPNKIGVQAWDYDYKRFQGKGEVEYAVGTSLAFWRETWEKHPYSETHAHEDPEFCKRVKVHTVNGVGLVSDRPGPHIIAEVHGGNNSSSYAVFDNHKSYVNPEWRRAPEWDDYCRERLYP